MASLTREGCDQTLVLRCLHLEGQLDSGSGESTAGLGDPSHCRLGMSGLRALWEHEARPLFLSPVGWWRCSQQAQGSRQGPGCGVEGRAGCVWLCCPSSASGRQEALWAAALLAAGTSWAPAPAFTTCTHCSHSHRILAQNLAWLPWHTGRAQARGDTPVTASSEPGRARPSQRHHSNPTTSFEGDCCHPHF